MYNSDHVFIYKDELMDWPMKVSAAWHLWIYLRMSVASKDEFQAVGSTNCVESVSFGQLVTSKQFLASQLHLTTRTINKYLKLLAEDGHIILQEEKNFIRITIPNYERFYTPSEAQKSKGAAIRADSQQICNPPIQPIAVPPAVHSTVHSTERSPQSQSKPAPQNSPESPIIIEEDKKKENNTSTTASNARASEEEFFERLRNSPAELEVIKTELKLKTVDEVLHMLNVFQMFISGKNEHHDNYGHFTSHFMSWHRKYTASKAYKKSAPKQGSGQPPRYEKPRNWRDNLGISSNAVTIEDYEEPI